jgi:catechol 2,3-dioxygenase-like lactoylglutathione lyase family enzyme
VSGRGCRWGVLGLLAAAVAAAAPAAAPAAPAGSAVLQVGLTVSDLDRSEEFFVGVLGFEKLGEEREVMGEPYERLEGVFGARLRVARLRLGGVEIELTEYLTPRGRAIPPDSRSDDRWFQHLAIVVTDIDAAYRRLREHRVRQVSTAPQRLPDWNPNAGGIRAFYFQDPDGHNLEVIWYPPGKGDRRWQERPPGRLFLGIDHTAIVVADTAASVAFYRGLLGMRVAGESENYGPEQERLNLVFGARLRITALRAPGGGPGIELLQYLAPPGGRPSPAGTAANDLIHWQTTLAAGAAGGLEELAVRLRAAGGQLVSPGPIDLGGAGAGLGFRRALLVRDPDGHALRLVEP